MKKSISKIIEQTYEFTTKDFVIRAKVKPDDVRIECEIKRWSCYIDVAPKNAWVVYRPFEKSWLTTKEEATDMIFDFVEENFNLIACYD